MQHLYTISTGTLNGIVDAERLTGEIHGSSITKALDFVRSTVSTDTLEIMFKAAIDAGEKVTLDALVSSHGGQEVVTIEQIEVTAQPPFSAKQLTDGRKLFRRVHGVKKALDGDTTIDLVVPYDQCKITAIEIVWAPAGLTVDLKVYDTPTGTLSTVPNYMLNQFGFSSGIAKDFYEESSQYDADLIKDMKIEALLKNPNNLTGDVCVNFILHEVKA